MMPDVAVVETMANKDLTEKVHSDPLLISDWVALF